MLNNIRFFRPILSLKNILKLHYVTGTDCSLLMVEIIVAKVHCIFGGNH